VGTFYIIKNKQNGHEVTLEEVFMELTGKALKDEEAQT
jgi:hypothetical protein